MSAKLKLYHPTSRGTGCAIGLELHPATAEQEGSIILEMAHQRTVGEIIGKSEFDWNDTACVRLVFNELTQILQVLRGELESTDDGTGFDPPSRPGLSDGHFGLQGVHERIRQLHGSVVIDSAPGRGTKVTVQLPTHLGEKRNG